MTEIVYANFSQLAYLNWGIKEVEDEINKKVTYLIERLWPKLTNVAKLESPKSDGNGNQLYDERDKRIFMVVSEEQGWSPPPKYKELSIGWEFLYFADHQKIYKDYLGIESRYSSGMQAAAFKKGNDIVIAYRGTEPSEVEDLLTDAEIGFFNRHSPHLTAAVLFYEYILKEYGSNSTIHITGHSLGGALAQYVACYAEGKHKTVTWNGLGIGVHKHSLKKGISGKINDIMQAIEINKMKSAEEIQNKYLNSEGEIDPILDLSNMKNIINDIAGIIIKNTHEYYNNQGKTEVVSFEIGDNWKGSFSMGSSHDSSYSYKLTDSEVKNIEASAEVSAYEIYWLLKTTQKFAKSYSKLENSDTIRNYFNTKDWTAMIQTRLGICINVLQEDIKYIDETDDSKMRVIRKTVKQIGFDYHSVNDFLLYMDDNGNMCPGKVNDNFVRNAAKDYFNKTREIGKFKDIVSGQNLKIKNGIEKKGYLKNITKDLLGKSNILSNYSKGYSKLKKQWKYLDVVVKSVTESNYSGYEKKLGLDDGKATYVIGKYINIFELAGIKGGKPTVIIDDLEEASEDSFNIPPIEKKLVANKEAIPRQKYRGFKENGPIRDYYL